MATDVASLPAIERVDPRILRTRNLLQNSLQRLLETKSFEAISVADIADEATLNRATFYDHYPDKIALLEGLVSTRFQELLDKRKVLYDGGCASAVTGIILAMCDYLTGMPGGDCPEHPRLEKHFESALMSVVRRMMLSGLEPSHAAPELVAATISGAIYGGVSEWARTSGRCPVEDAVQVIFTLIQPMLHPRP